MNFQQLARDQWRRSGSRIGDAQRAYRDRRYADATRFAQESVELALKAALRAYGVEVPKQHDVAPVFEELSRVLPGWFASELPWIRTVSSDLAARRSLAMYGDEQTGRPASELFDRPADVGRWLAQARRIVRLAGRIVGTTGRAGAIRARRRPP